LNKMNAGLDSSALIYAYVAHVKSGSHSWINSDSIAILISVGAFIVSIALPLFLDSRQSPKVSVRISRVVYFDPKWNATECYVISAINHGRSEVQINQVNVSYIKKGKHGVEVFLPFLDFRTDPNLPHTLAPYSDVSFAVTQEQVNELIGDLKGCRIYGSLHLSSGYRAVSRRGLAPGITRKLPNRHPRLRRLRLIVFGKENSRWR
jgi:hypothetical protein